MMSIACWVTSATSTRRVSDIPSTRTRDYYGLWGPLRLYALSFNHHTQALVYPRFSLRCQPCPLYSTHSGGDSRNYSTHFYTDLYKGR